MVPSGGRLKAGSKLRYGARKESEMDKETLKWLNVLAAAVALTIAIIKLGD